MPIAGLIEKLSIIKGRREESDFVTMTLGETQKEEQETLTKRYSVCEQQPSAGAWYRCGDTETSIAKCC